ncbi:MAG: PAAR-like protein [Lachnoanaerobaculum saburreum]
MHEQQLINGPVIKEYIVRGAEVSCKYGSKTGVLNLSRDHGSYNSDGRPLIIKSDCTSKNISGFDVCNKNRNKPCKCEPKLNEWSVDEKSKLCIIDPNTAKGSRAITVDSITVCEKGGIVSFKTSGQATPSYDNAKVKDAVEIVENVKGTWRRLRDKGDFVGHVKVKNSGLYNFGVVLHHGKTTLTAGSVFVYESSWGKLRCIDEYEIKRHVGNEEQKFPEDMLKISGNSYESVPNAYYWNYWVNIALYANRDYYFEIDCFEENAIDYKLIGNQDTTVLSTSKDRNVYNDTISGIWIMNSKFKKKNPDIYEDLSRRNNRGTPAIIMYLNVAYISELNFLIDTMIEEDKHWLSPNKASESSENIGWASLFFTGLSYGIPALLKYLGLMGAEIAGAITGGISAGLAVIGALFTLSSKDLLKKLKNEIIKRGTMPTKIILYDVYADLYGDNGWGDYSLKPFTITKFDIGDFDEYREGVATTIYGQKCLEGKFILLTGYSTEDNDKKAENIEKLGNSLKSNEWRIR